MQPLTELPPRLQLAHLPTPLWRNPALDQLLGVELWVKRDDMSGGAEAGNKIRKLEFLLAQALERNATSVLTCGGVQSNHARATAIAARQLGMRAVLFLRSEDAAALEASAPAGNLMLDRLVGADVRFITKAQYQDRDRLMSEAARELEQHGERPYVIGEGGSSGLGALGYVHAVRETAKQLRDQYPGVQFDGVVVGCGSGGTSAGVALGLAENPIAPKAIGVCVCDDAGYFREATHRIVAEARQLCPGLPEPAPLELWDEFKGPAYGVMDSAQAKFLGQVAETSGLILDPVYSGKALYGVARRATEFSRLLFIHTGGLPGLLAQPDVVPGPERPSGHHFGLT